MTTRSKRSKLSTPRSPPKDGGTISKPCGTRRSEASTTLHHVDTSPSTSPPGSKSEMMRDEDEDMAIEGTTTGSIAEMDNATSTPSSSRSIVDADNPEVHRPHYPMIQ